MKTRTIEELCTTIDSSLAWRKKELASLLSMVRESKHKSVKEETIVRAGVAMLYAHWEGFVKESVSLYLDHVERRKLTYRDLAPGLVALAVRSRVNTHHAQDIGPVIEVVRTLRDNSAMRCTLPLRDAVPRVTNLSSSMLRYLVTVSNLDYSPFVTKEKVIDVSLLDQRNAIAHGQHLSLDREGYEELHSHVVELLDAFRDEVENAAATASYRSHTKIQR